MSPENFCFWLQGHFEMNPNNDALTADQVKMIREHLQLVFKHVGVSSATPAAAPTSPSTQLEKFFKGGSIISQTTPPGSTVVC